MALMRDLERGGKVLIDLKTNHKLGIDDEDGDRQVTVQLVYKRGNKFARLAIDAPSDISVEVLPPDGVAFPNEGA
jgi:hypothetical protein